MGKPSAPAPPDPKQTSAAQTGTSVATALANANLQNVSQVTPNGSLKYSQSGSYQFTDPYTGETYNIPQFTATQTLSPDQQKLYDLNNKTQQNLANTGVQQSEKIGSLLNTPFDPNSAVEDKIDQIGRERLDPQFSQSEDALRTRLANQGIMPGSQAFNAEMQQFNQGKNDAYDQLYLQGNQQAFQQAQATRNQPINEITALLSGSQVSQPNFINPQEPTIPTTDNASIINQNYNQKLANYQMQVQQQNALLGGLFGLGAAGVYKFSDKRMKENIKKVGKTRDGLGIYSYRYKGSPTTEIGLLAQEVRKKKPEAIAETPTGLMAVNYEVALSQ